MISHNSSYFTSPDYFPTVNGFAEPQHREYDSTTVPMPEPDPSPEMLWRIHRINLILAGQMSLFGGGAA